MRAEAGRSASGSDARLRADVARAATVLFPVWPLSSFVAVNPLGDLSDRDFESALAIAREALGIDGLPEPRWLARALDHGRIEPADLRAAALRARGEGRGEPDPDWIARELQSAGSAPRGPRRGTPCERLDAADGGTRAAKVDAEVAKWCAAFFDLGEAAWKMPDRELGLYAAWRPIAGEDAGSRKLGAGDLRPAARALPDSAQAALAELLDRLGVAEGQRVSQLRMLLGRSPGWASAVRWQAERSGASGPPVDLIDYLAILCFYELALAGTGAAAAPAASADGEDPAVDPRLLGLEAYEWHYRDRLLSALDGREAQGAVERPDAQAVFCIDARSEGLRRHLEGTGSYETLGFAGFFALAVSHRPLGSSSTYSQCPVLVGPVAEIGERPLPGSEEAARRWLGGLQRNSAAIETLHQTKNDLSSKFVLAELAGWAFGAAAFARTIAPAARLGSHQQEPPTRVVTERPTREQAEAEAARLERARLTGLARAHLGRAAARLEEHVLEELRLHALGAPPPRRPRGASKRRWEELLVATTEFGIDPDSHEELVREIGGLGMTVAEQIDWAQVTLRMMGLTSGFARLVLLCGHGSSNVNNPYRSALDCGACGGLQGGPNARAAAQILNSEPVRSGLAEAGIEIPLDTVFIAGLHDTTTDRVRIFDREQIPSTHRGDVLALEADLETAGESLSAERLEQLGERSATGGALRRTLRRSRDWAQVRPEWGLARNAAFIVGPREASIGIDLECRTFLHSYRAEADPSGSALETILTAPLVVAEWINLQYYFSSVDPDVLGAGDKTLHNVVGRRGVQLGPGGDLKLGLPRQAVFAGRDPYHEPMRLLAVVQAPLDRIDAIIARNPVLKEMFGGGWVAMCARERPQERWQRLRRDLRWEPWRSAQAIAEAEPNEEERQCATTA